MMSLILPHLQEQEEAVCSVCSDLGDFSSKKADVL